MEPTMKSYKLPKRFCVMESLGQGISGEVLKCFNTDTCEHVAVKVLTKRDPKPREIREILMLKKLRHLDLDETCIIKCHECFHFDDHHFIVMELLDMSVHDYQCKTRAVLPLHGIRTIVRDLATALAALKSLSVIHTDIKLDNVMLIDHAKKPFRVKLIDFGLSLPRCYARPGMAVQPLWYRAPEIILGLPFTEAIDIWSLGVLMGHMLFGFHLFPGQHEYEVLLVMTEILGVVPKRLLEQGQKTEAFYRRTQNCCGFTKWKLKTPEEYFKETGRTSLDNIKSRTLSLDAIKDKCAEMNLHLQNNTTQDKWITCVDLLQRMLQLDPTKRITPRQILAHQFLTEHDSSNSFNPQDLQRMDSDGLVGEPSESTSTPEPFGTSKQDLLRRPRKPGNQM